MAMRLDHGADDLTEVHDINVTPFIDGEIFQMPE